MNKQICLQILREFEIDTTFQEILFPKNQDFPEEVHEAIDFLIDKCDYGIQYINR